MRILEVGNGLFLRLKARGECDFFSSLIFGAKMRLEYYKDRRSENDDRIHSN
jgi:hypothetical protein